MISLLVSVFFSGSSWIALFIGKPVQIISLLLTTANLRYYTVSGYYVEGYGISPLYFWDCSYRFVPVLAFLEEILCKEMKLG
jgi:hypothetical protein